LMIAQDVGSAIRGPERGDIFWGTGAAAGAIAGSTRHKAQFHRLLPNR
jgi:membrane-bound lytic murein transglycosylase A